MFPHAGVPSTLYFLHVRHRVLESVRQLPLVIRIIFSETGTRISAVTKSPCHIYSVGRNSSTSISELVGTYEGYYTDVGVTTRGEDLLIGPLM